ncbi:MAG: hypothetical protein WBIAU2_03720 [Wolbachia endosymbiont of Drosophila biauraria]|nr:MAG: hypothetical protein WBIAU2_03720 [Wolbachia endosymbiont of Drosophila biauraria]
MDIKTERRQQDYYENRQVCCDEDRKMQRRMVLSFHPKTQSMGTKNHIYEVD